MLSVERTEAAEKELDRFINSRSKDREKANAEAALERAEDLRRHDEYREECRELWAIHLRRLAGSYLRLARDARRRARALETNVKENSA